MWIDINNDSFGISYVYPNILKMLFRFLFFLIGFSLIMPLCLNSQADVFLQIEEINSPESIKLPVGSTIVFKASKYSDQWQKGRIKEIVYDGNTIIFDHTFVPLHEIEKIKIKNFGGQAIGYSLQAFGIGWLTLGTIAELTNVGDENNLSSRNLIIGATAIGSGILIQKVSGNKVYTNNKTHRFRLIDLRFSVDEN